MSTRKMIRSMRKADEQGVDLSKFPFVMTEAEFNAFRPNAVLPYRDPLTHVGPVKSGTMREFEEPKT